MILALNKIGAAYVPIEPSFPSNRIEHIINTARSEQLITTKDIADDFDVLDNSDDMGSEIINQILNDSNDFVTEFFVQLYQNGDDYSLTISHSNRYSERMINDFKDTYISVLSNIITVDLYSNLNYH